MPASNKEGSGGFSRRFDLGEFSLDDLDSSPSPRMANWLLLLTLAGCSPDTSDTSWSDPWRHTHDSGDDEGGDSDSGVDSDPDSGDSGIELDSGDSGDSGETGDTGEIEVPEEIEDNMTSWQPDDYSVGSNLAEAAMNSYSLEPSGIIWDLDRETYFIVDDGGALVELGPFGSIINYWFMGGDLEAMGIDYYGRRHFVANESDSTINGVDVTTGEFTSDYCTVSNLEVEPPLGFEGLAFVPAEHAPESWGGDDEGFFVAGSQADAELHIYKASSCVDGAELISVATIQTTATDVSGLHYNLITQRLYVLHDSSDLIEVYKLDGTFVTSYSLPSDDRSDWGGQEGITVVLNYDDCGEDSSSYSTAEADLAIADDYGGWFMFSGFPVSCQYEI
jgi:uncharacterized protein YjiK